MPTKTVNKLTKIALLLFLAIFISCPQLNTYASAFTGYSGQSYSNYSPPVDYRYMALYQLKLNRYYHPSGSGNPNNVHVEHTHHHTHWGWWDVPVFLGSLFQ